MDCRVSLLFGMAAGVFVGTTGCTPSLFTRPDTPTSQTVSKDALSPRDRELVKKEKDLPKRKPKAATCVSFGDFRLREAMAPTRTKDQQRAMLAEARKAYQQALEIDPRCLEAHRGIAQSYQAEENREQAIGAFQSALRLMPEHAGLWFELGMLHSRQKEWEPAVEALAQSAALEPNNRRYTNLFGYCLARAGKYEQSLDYFSRVVGAARAHYNVGRMMIHNGQVEGGKQQLQRALELEPKLTEASEELARLDNLPGQGVKQVKYEVPAQQP